MDKATDVGRSCEVTIIAHTILPYCFYYSRSFKSLSDDKPRLMYDFSFESSWNALSRTENNPAFWVLKQEVSSASYLGTNPIAASVYTHACSYRRVGCCRMAVGNKFKEVLCADQGIIKNF